MKRKKKIHSGVCITDERIVCVTGHIENKTLVLTDALEMKRSSTIDEDITKFIETHDLDEGAYSIVSDIETQMHLAQYDPHDFDMQEFIKNDVEEYFNFEGDSFQMDACRREYPRHHYHMFMVAVERHSLELLKQGIRDTYAPVDVIDFWPIPSTYALNHRSGTITGVVENKHMHLWAWWQDICVAERIIPITRSDVEKAIFEMGTSIETYGQELKSIKLYGLETLSNAERMAMEDTIQAHGETEYIPLLFLGRARTRCKLGEIDWDMAIGMVARGLKWIGLGW